MTTFAKLNNHRITGNQSVMQQIEMFAAVHDLKWEISIVDSIVQASFKGCEIKRTSGCLLGEYGQAKTEVMAMRDYAFRISGATLVIDAYEKERREIVAWDF